MKNGELRKQYEEEKQSWMREKGYLMSLKQNDDYRVREET